jgi:hypothetical protein
MPTFLECAAQHVFSRYRHNLDRVTVILPTHRSAYFFRRTLAAQTEDPVWAPRIVAIDDFITEAADARPVDPIGLVWLLYDVCKEIDPHVQFDRFTGWAHTLLLDFDKIDQYLVDAAGLFDYLSEAKALERWEPDHTPGRPLRVQSKVMEGYFLLWQNLHRMYRRLKERLREEGQAYRGMMYRQVAEDPSGLLTDPDTDAYVFVGLNALSASEEVILKALLKAHRAEVLWDTDAYYMDRNLGVKAGDVLRKYKKDRTFGVWNWQFDDLVTGEKDIHVIGVPNATMQGKVAVQLYHQGRLAYQLADHDADAEAPEETTAIVLPDENLLLPVLESLDATVKDFNITMGLSLRQSNLFTLVDALFTLQYLALNEYRSGHKTVKYNHRHLMKVLTHPFVSQYDQLRYREAKEARQANGTDGDEAAEPITTPVRAVMYHIGNHNVIYITPEDLLKTGSDDGLLRVLLTPWFAEPAAALSCFRGLIEQLREVYKARREAIEIEYLYLFATIVRRLDTILKERYAKPNAEKLSLRSFRLFLYELFKQTRIPFSGEPVSTLQIMGMLETRTLDYDTVIILSANEKTLPQPKKQNSLIPLDACREFNLPTYRSQEATMSYHFYRLLQRAKKVYLLYVSAADTYGAGEKSRFIYQLEHELTRYNPRIRLHHQTAQVREQAALEAPFIPRVDKTEAVRTAVRAAFEKGIYPSQLNMYVNCSLQFYLGVIAGIRGEEEVEENMGAAAFGNLVHKTLENLDKDLAGQDRPMLAADLEAVLPSLPERVRKEFLEFYPGYDLESGLNYLMYKIAVRVIRNFLEQLIKSDVFPLQILGLERTLSADFHVTVHGQVIPVKVSGRIDRIDKVGDTIRVVDYKTGKIERKHLRGGVDTRQMLLTDPEADKVRQLWLYKYILAKRLIQDGGIQLPDRLVKADGAKLVAGFYSLRNIEAGLLDDALPVGDGVTLESYVQQTEGYLQTMLSDLLDPAQPFGPTDRLESCVYCAYKRICGR